MEDAAQGEPRKHEVFTTPFRVEPKFEFWPTPDNYRDRSLGEKVPDKIKVWRVQSGRPGGRSTGGVVSRLYGFEDSPDAEILTAGFNVGKESGAVGVGRHGNFLQWGFSAPPSKMTDPGRKFFLNCVVYIAKFDGKPPLVRRQSSHRVNALRLAKVINADFEDKSFPDKYYPPDLVKRFGDDPDGLMGYYRDHIELIYRGDKIWLIDKQLRGLGIGSNRKVSTLEKLIALLGEEKHAQAAKRLLKRYTTQSFATQEQWEGWLKENRDRIYFSDVGGYKFRVVPKGYLDLPKK